MERMTARFSTPCFLKSQRFTGGRVRSHQGQQPIPQPGWDQEMARGEESQKPGSRGHRPPLRAPRLLLTLIPALSPATLEIMSPEQVGLGHPALPVPR